MMIGRSFRGQNGFLSTLSTAWFQNSTTLLGGILRRPVQGASGTDSGATSADSSPWNEQRCLPPSDNVQVNIAKRALPPAPEGSAFFFKADR